MSQKYFLFFLGLYLLILSIIFITNFNSITGNAIGVGNSTAITQATLTVGESYPEIKGLTLSSENLELIPNSTSRFDCMAIVIDYNGRETIENINAVIYSRSTSNRQSPNDKNIHYTNPSCSTNISFGSWNGIYSNEYNVLATCSFDIEFYAEPGEWTCGLGVSDDKGLTEYMEENFTIMGLMSLGVPDYISYGRINSTYVSNETTINVTNYGNTEIDIYLSGYGAIVNDGYSMKCDLGDEGISVGYHKYEMISIPGELSLTEFESFYTNLTSQGVFEEYNLNYRHNDTEDDATNSTYWRVYVPRGVAGDCSGNIVFSATSS